MSKKFKIGDVIKSNNLLKKRLLSRFNELSLINKEIVKDAEEKDYKIPESSLSRYLTKPYGTTGSLSQEQILWLCMRYCIPVRLVIRPYKVLEDPMKRGVPPGTLVPFHEGYNEKKAIDDLVKHFGYNPAGRKQREPTYVHIKGKPMGRHNEQELIDDIIKNPEPTKKLNKKKNYGKRPDKKT